MCCRQVCAASEQLKNAVAKIEGKIETVKEKAQENENVKIIPADPSVRNFTHTLADGKLFFRENEIMTEVAETGKILDRMLGLHKIRHTNPQLKPYKNQAKIYIYDFYADFLSTVFIPDLDMAANGCYRRAGGGLLR